jgi:hypothetical protein
VKHNHTTRRAQRSGLSSYKRHEKREFLYSEGYQRWKAAAKVGGNPADAREEARKHALRFLGFDATSPEERRRQDRIATASATAGKDAA